MSPHFHRDSLREVVIYFILIVILAFMFAEFLYDAAHEKEFKVQFQQHHEEVTAWIASCEKIIIETHQGEI